MKHILDAFGRLAQQLDRARLFAMGASQSTGGGAAEGQAGVEVKTSYYELLSVERTATQDE